ncbi:ion channel [Bacteroidota bacterium]
MKRLLNIFHEKNKSHLLWANIILLTVVALMLVGVAFFPSGIQPTLNKILSTAILLCSIYALASRTKILFPIAIILIMTQWFAKISGRDSLEIVSSFINTIFYTYIVVKLVRQFVKAKTVSPLVILGSINGYLLMGLVFSIFTIVVSWLYPNSYSSMTSNTYLTAEINFHTYIYYTFITMATVGYGDIVPVSAAARALAVFISVSGQFYIAILVAFLVGKFAGIHVNSLKK